MMAMKDNNIPEKSSTFMNALGMDQATRQGKATVFTIDVVRRSTKDLDWVLLSNGSSSDKATPINEVMIDKSVIAMKAFWIPWVCPDEATIRINSPTSTDRVNIWLKNSGDVLKTITQMHVVQIA